jgi:hypothetical protein
MLEFDPDEEGAFPFKDITQAIIGAAFEVHNELGYGYLHRVYQRSLQVDWSAGNTRPNGRRGSTSATRRLSLATMMPT